MCKTLVENLEDGPLRPTKGSAGAPAYSFQGDTDTGFDSLGADQLDLITGGTARWRVSSGISSRSPITPTTSARPERPGRVMFSLAAILPSAAICC